MRGCSSRIAFLLCGVVILLAGSAAAQLTQTGNLNGMLKDPDGFSLPGVSITIKSPVMMLPSMTTVTDERGSFRFPSLAPGAYEVEFVLDGFNKLVQTDVPVSVGKTSTLDVTLEVKTMDEALTVTSTAPVIDKDKTTKTINLDAEVLSLLPAVRNLTTYFNMAPGVTSESAHGGSVRDNTFNLDGVNLSDPTVGTQGVFFGMDIMQEISVQQGGLSAEYGSVRGAVINVVSKSGGNAFKGAASVYYRNKSLQSENTKGTPLEGRVTGYKYEIEPGFYLGGPLMKEKLWFFGNLSLNKNERTVSGFPYDAADDAAVNDTRPYPYLKLTWQRDDANRYILSYNNSDIRFNNRGASKYRTVESTWEQKTPTHVVNAHWTNILNNDFFMNLKLGYVNSTFNMLTKSDNASSYENSTRRSSGSAGYDDLNGRDRLQVNNDWSYYLGDMYGTHDFKWGGEFQYAWTSRALNFKNDPRNDMYYVVTNGGAPWYGYHYANIDEREKMMNFAGFVQDTWNPMDKLTVNMGLRFEHNRGMIPKQNEDEGPQTFLGYTYDRSVTDGYTAMSWTTLAPRLGAVYDVTGSGKTLVKVSYSRYYTANITQWFSMNNPNGFFYYGSLLNPDGTDSGQVFDFGLPGQTEIGYGDHGLKDPYVDEVTVGFEKELYSDWSVGARYIRKWDRNLIEDVDSTALDIDKLLNAGVLDWTNYSPVTVTDPYSGQPVTFWNREQLLNSIAYVVNPPGADRDYDGFELTFGRRNLYGVDLTGSYVWQDSRGLIGTDFNDSWGGSAYFNDANAHQNNEGRFTLERRHQFKVSGLYRAPWGINAAVYYRFLSGQRYSRLVRSQDLGVDLAQGPTNVNAESRGSFGYPSLSIFDVHVEKGFKVFNQSFAGFMDIFNLFNGNSATGVQNISSNPTEVFGTMTAIQDPRMLRLGAKYTF